MSTIGIVGLGLIGGSMAKSIKARTGHTVLGIDIDRETMELAIMSGSIDSPLDDDNLKSCDLLLVALPPQALLRWVTENAPKIAKHTMLIDLCGVKRAICSVITPLSEKYGFSYIGGHPMAGKEVSGFKSADSALFSGASMILTPDKNTDIVMLDKLKAFFLEIGFETLTFTTPEEHDRIISYTSQLAHICSSSYVKSPTAQTHMGFSAGSFKDMTRVARLDENMWTELFSANRDNLVGELEELIKHLTDYLDAIKADDQDKLRQLLKTGRELKATAGGN
ncbi:MAG: prephenate dehydrogenase [Oscillospiraceae bacterium]